MILVFIIAALLLIVVVKPMFRQSQSLAQSTPIVSSS
jgi:competence protein ComGC